MAANSDAAGGNVEGAPDAFRRTVEDLMSASWRSELSVEELPAPQRIVPFSAAITADVVVNGEELGSGDRRGEGHVSLRDIRACRHRSGDGDRPAAAQRGLVLADRCSREP